MICISCTSAKGQWTSAVTVANITWCVINSSSTIAWTQKMSKASLSLMRDSITSEKGWKLLVKGCQWCVIEISLLSHTSMKSHLRTLMGEFIATFARRRWKLMRNLTLYSWGVSTHADVTWTLVRIVWAAIMATHYRSGTQTHGTYWTQFATSAMSISTIQITSIVRTTANTSCARTASTLDPKSTILRNSYPCNEPTKFLISLYNNILFPYLRMALIINY